MEFASGGAYTESFTACFLIEWESIEIFFEHPSTSIRVFCLMIAPFCAMISVGILRLLVHRSWLGRVLSLR